jgi:predicted O-methyltransferase YrrM
MDLLGTTTRHRLVATLVVLLGLLMVICMATEQWSVGAAAGGLLLAGVVLVALDIRRRVGDLRRRLAREAEATDQVARAVEPLASEMHALADAVSAIESALGDERSRMADERRRNAAGLRRIVELLTQQPQEIEALLQLYGRVSPMAPMPPSGKWALNPTGLLNLYALIEQHRPGLVVELGSGTSTVWLGYGVVQQRHGRVVSVDHLPDYAERTRLALGLHGLSSVTEVRHAPLTEIMVGDDTYRWYEQSAFADLDQIDLLFIDGPPGSTGHDARYPAVPLLLQRLADGALVVLDDIERTEEQQIVERWLQYVSGLSREATLLGDQAVLRYRLPAATASDIATDSQGGRPGWPEK